MTLRIQKSDERNRVVLTLIGRIRADQVSELEALLTSVPDYDSMVLDLKDVKLVGATSETGTSAALAS